MSCKSNPARIPLQPFNVIGTQFSLVTFDLVGLLLRILQRYRYLLTCICLGSKYPITVHIKNIEARRVAEAMMDIFSIIGFPAEVLTDQGSVL